MTLAEKALSRIARARDRIARPEPFECRGFDEAPVERNLLVFIDGTNNDPSARDPDKQTNVCRMSRLVDDARGPGIPQRVIYHAGVGSATDDPNYVSAVIRQLGGRGVDRILDEVYLEVIKKYHPGDRIFILGFSRGATLARMLANRLADEGIPRRGVARYHQYGTAGSVTGKPLELLDRIEPDEEELPKEIQRIEALGLWDSVASIGPLERLFERAPKLGIPDCVQKTYHLVAIDESRVGFAPSLIEPNDRVEEIWFPGVHTDVGGGYAKAGLANITLHFMMNRLSENHGIRFRRIPECETCQKRKQDHLRGRNTHPEECTTSECHTPNLHATVHRHPAIWPKRTRQIRTRDGSQPPRIHKSAVERLESTLLCPPYRPRQLVKLHMSKAYTPDDRD